jgi:cytochrome c oxidase subunit 3
VRDPVISTVFEREVEHVPTYIGALTTRSKEEDTSGIQYFVGESKGMTQAATHHSPHETSLWPLLTGSGVLLSVLALLTYFEWQMPVLAIVMGGGVLALLAIGLAGWAREFFTSGTEEGLGPVAVAAFIVSEVIIFGTVFAVFWLGRIDNADQWASFIPADLDRTFAIWLTVILWASSATIVLSQRAFESADRGAAKLWLAATFVLGSLFVVLHVNEWNHLAGAGFQLGTNIYATTFYMMTGVHTAHLVVGLFNQMLLFGVLAGGLMPSNRATLFRGTSLYWHFVDIMWLMVAANAYFIGGTA